MNSIKSNVLPPSNYKRLRLALLSQNSVQGLNLKMPSDDTLDSIEMLNKDLKTQKLERKTLEFLHTNIFLLFLLLTPSLRLTAQSESNQPDLENGDDFRHFEYLNSGFSYGIQKVGKSGQKKFTRNYFEVLSFSTHRNLVPPFPTHKQC